jgi:Zn-dependent peptidase ImmA (M78 family)
LLGDHCSFAPDERLIPETDAKTSRQQFQRAFAQEFLCPFEALKETINLDHPDEECIAKAADRFGVSPLLVRTTLVNKGELDRQSLAWVD